MSNLKMYIAVLDEFPDYMCPTLVAHAVLGAHQVFDDHFLNVHGLEDYRKWLNLSFKKCVVRVNQKEFDKISLLDNVYLAHENNTLEGRKACAVVCPREELPNVLKFAKLWKPKVFVPASAAQAKFLNDDNESLRISGGGFPSGLNTFKED